MNPAHKDDNQAQTNLEQDSVRLRNEKRPFRPFDAALKAATWRGHSLRVPARPWCVASCRDTKSADMSDALQGVGWSRPTERPAITATPLLQTSPARFALAQRRTLAILARMRLVVGLGNPGRQYQRTPHNVGFEIVDKIAERNHLYALTWRSRTGS